jgi:hypothetical protein
MGLFALATKNTVEDYVETAISNLRLYLEHNNGNPLQGDYLLDFALHNVLDAKEKIAELQKKP